MRLLLAILLACGASKTPSTLPLENVVCMLDHKDVDEASGLVLGSQPGTFWTHNDSGGEPVIYGFDQDGKALATVRVDGATARDWEEMAAFDMGGKRFLIVADMGDNLRQRDDLALYLFEEPDLSTKPKKVTPKRTIRFRFPDEPHDAEALAVDPEGQTILLVTKDRDDGTRVYSLPLQPASAPVLTATEITRLELGPPRDESRRRVTAMDISPDGRRVALLTYVDAWVWEREPGQDWHAVFAGDRTAVELPPLMQREGMCFSEDGTALYVNSEGQPMPMVRMAIPGSAASP